MKPNCRFLLIPLLVAALVSLGIGRAGAVVCTPVCDHCRTVPAAPSCCDEMVGSGDSRQQPAKAGENRQSAGCDYGQFCSGDTGQGDVSAGLTAPGAEPAALLTEIAGQVISGRYSTLSAVIRLKAPPRGKPRPLYTLNCSFLI